MKNIKDNKEVKCDKCGCMTKVVYPVYVNNVRLEVCYDCYRDMTKDDYMD